VARKKTPPLRVNVKAQISNRLREIRWELFGDHGGPELARRLGLPARTWYNYESGVTVPAEVLLAFIEQTGVNPLWLLAGEGPKYRRGVEDAVMADLTPEQLIRRGLEKLEQAPHEVVLVTPQNLGNEEASNFIAVDLMPLEALLDSSGRHRSMGHVLAYRQWIPHPRETVAVSVGDDAMHPILPAGAVVAVDRAVTEPLLLQGKLVAAAPDDSTPVIRWLEVSGRHLILRPNLPSREHPMIPIELRDTDRSPILGQVVWSWSRFAGV
jgi:transcriptional regulator with XRE-family HTH domain